MKFNDRLKFLRIEKGFETQKELAKKIGMPYTTYNGYENGIREPDIETLKGFASFFDVTLDYLMGRSDFKKGRLLSKEELREFLPDDEVDNQDWGITVDDLNELSEETKQQIKEVLRKAGYLKKGL